MRMIKTKKQKNNFNSNIIIYTTISIFLVIFLYRNFISKEDYSIQKLYKMQGNYYVNNLEDKGELTELVNSLKVGCFEDEECIKDNFFKYVKNIPYCISEKDRKPKEVILKNGGDCDEKAFLFSSLLIEKNYKGVLIYTKTHTFSAVEYNTIEKNMARLEFENKKYYYAETTDINGKIGKYNNINKDQIIGVYNINTKKKIPLEKIEIKID